MLDQYTDWDRYFIDLARLIAKKSKDKSVKVGMVIVGPDHEIRSTGYNGFPRGINEEDSIRWERPIKYSWVEHAERNAIYNAARMGTSINRCTAYIDNPPCIACGRALIQSGIKEIVISSKHSFKFRSDWNKEFKFATKMLQEAGVKITWIDY